MNPADANFPLRVWSEAAARGLFTAIWGLKITGLENVPLLGPAIIACNHASMIDPPLMAAALSPRRRPFGLGKKELYANPLIGRLLRDLGSFPLDRGGDATSAMRAALDVLEKGGCLSIHPEGTRVRPGQTRAAKPGVAFLSFLSGAPVVPMRLLGTAQFPSSFPLEVRIGAPLAPPEAEDRATGLAYAKHLMERIYSL